MGRVEKIFIIVFSLLAILFLVWIVSNFLGYPLFSKQVSYSEVDYQRAKASEIKDNPCATPPGYTDKEWREHMGHHPDQYKECLK